MKTKRVVVSVIFSCALIFTANAQQVTNGNIETDRSIKPLRIGVKLGTPGALTLNAEYVTPLLDNRVAPFIDYLSLSYNVEDTEVAYSNFEIGSNIYLSDSGKGLYAGLSYFSHNSEGSFPEVEFDSGFYDGKADLEFSTLNMKIGAKLGRVFYFRIEAGYGFGKLPQSVTVRSNETNETTVEEFPEIFGYSENGALILNIGFGFGFL